MSLLRPIPLKDVRVTDTFWSRYQRALSEKGLHAQHDQLVKTDRLLNFERVIKGESGGFEGFRFNDSDVYKWIEAVAYSLHHVDSGDLRKKMFDAVDLIAAAQQEDGYLNTYFQLNQPDLKWRNLHAMHEMYCAGHLIEAAVAVLDSTGDRRLLEVGIKLADHIASIFGPGKRIGTCGHEEIELALVKLARATGNDSYRDLAKWMIEIRGQRPSFFEAELSDEAAFALAPPAGKILLKDGAYNGEYLQDHLPLREHTEVVGHAVRAMYFYIAAADLDPDPEIKAALERTWENLTKKRMYVTGGIGPSGDNEGFTTDYDLPNLSAYAETCAASGLAFWGQSLLQMTGNSEYADTVERALYNGALAGISLDTAQYFYDNPLESRGRHERKPWFSCACCPPNIARLIGSVSNHAVSVSKQAFWIHIPIGLEANVVLNGVPVKISVRSDYPWSGKIEVMVEPDKPVQAELRFRIPEWTEDVETDVPGLDEEAGFDQGYIVIRKTWKSGDVARFTIDMTPKWVTADPRVLDDLGRVALTCGPLVYAAESQDLGFYPQAFSADTEAELISVPEPKLEGIRAVMTPGLRETDVFPDQLFSDVDALSFEEVVAKFIPYYAWGNRGPNHMQVWVRKL